MTSLPEKAQRICGQVDAFGFCILRLWDAGVDTFKAVARLFGAIQPHVRSGTDGIVGSGPAANNEWQAFKDQYKGLGCGDFPPHTDGSFLDGLASVAGQVIRVEPPGFVLLQCVEPARNGGENLIVDGRRVFIDVLAQDREIAGILLRRGCASFCRDDMLAANCRIYERLSRNRYRVRFRRDSTLYVPDWSSQAVRVLDEDYLRNDAYTRWVRLRHKDVLVIDNHRVLHGRRAFTESPNNPRQFRRIWIAAEPVAVLTNHEGKTVNRRAFAAYHAYAADSAERSDKAGRLALTTGIRLDPASASLAEELRFEQRRQGRGAGSERRRASGAPDRVSSK
ncbi:MAG: TauD/TfdA family dioxygenase [Proteobacteria bacterium]|nr:TauD/TfdA family dioxygenase [Pseudomonadota bacterium]